MAYSTSASSFPALTNEEFNLFHSIDRKLYSILIFYLGRDPAESMQVMALWLWLERTGHDSGLVKKLLSIPVTLVNAVADETVICLNCVETDGFPIDSDGNDIPTLQSLLKNCVGIRYFHENRIRILRGVTKIMNEVCARAFEDILKNTSPNNPLFHTHSGGESVGESSGTTFENNEGNVSVVPVGYYPSLLPVSTHMVHTYDPYDLATQREFLNNDLGDWFRHLSLSVTKHTEEGKEVLSVTKHTEEEKEVKEVPKDDRTIFLTFSKGYPVLESEIREFFTATFGDFIEAIYMQEVPPDEQALYARVVVHSVASIDVVLSGQSKAKFTISGKHIWARKYVRKNPTSPSAVTSPSQPPFPVGVPEP